MASNAENVSTWSRHHVSCVYRVSVLLTYWQQITHFTLHGPAFSCWSVECTTYHLLNIISLRREPILYFRICMLCVYAMWTYHILGSVKWIYFVSTKSSPPAKQMWPNLASMALYIHIQWSNLDTVVCIKWIYFGSTKSSHPSKQKWPNLDSVVSYGHLFWSNSDTGS